ncbi:hypothetical protein ACLOJK_027478 [Asimina triloba]
MTVHEDNPVRSTVRRTRKKKYAELKKEVDLLLLEKSSLKKEFERLARSRKQLKLKNERLKQLLSSLECQPPKETTDMVSNTSQHPTRVIFDLNLPAPDDEAASSLPSDEIYGMS